MESKRFHCGLLAFLLLFENSAAIQCYYCNSANNSACIDISQFEKYDIVPLVDCDLSIHTPHSEYHGRVQFFCRKIVQTIFHGNGREPELRVTRGCGWIPHHSDCYRADNEGHAETVCQCFQDECNSAPKHTAAILCPAFVVIVAMVTNACLYLY